MAGEDITSECADYSRALSDTAGYFLPTLTGKTVGCNIHKGLTWNK
jgi:hypothetical protein